MAYTIQEVGARVRAKNPGAFANYTDEQIGQRVADRNPKIKALISTTTPAQPVQQPTQPTQQVQQPQPEKKLFGNSILGKVGNFLTESEQKLGSTIGQGLALASGTGKSIDESNKKLIESGNELIKLAQQTTDPVKKKQRLDLAKKNFEQAGVNYKEVVPDIQKSNKQIAGEFLGTALDVVTAGTAPKVLSGVVKSARVPSLAAKLPASTIAKSALKGVATGMPLGAAYGVSGALQEDKDLKGTLTSGALGGALGGVIGASTGAVGAKVSNALKYNPARATAKVEAQADKLARKIVQGVDKDVAKARNVLRSIDAKGVKTAEDLVGAVNKNLEAIGNKVDEKLLTNNNLYNIADLTVTKKVGNKSVSENFVVKALDNLEELYTKTDDIVSAEQIKQLKAKAQSQGLTAKEVNDLAKNYGSEFGSKAFSKIGEPLTSVNAQSYENIRKGIKESARSLFDDEALKTLDKELSEHIRVKDLAVKFQKGVSNLENRVKDRAPLELVGRVVGRVLDTVTGGSARGFLTSFLPSNIGNKTMNYLDLEKALNKNLKALQKLENSKQFDLEKEIQKAINYFKKKLPEATSMKQRPGFAKIPFVGDDERDILLKKLNDLTTSDFRTVGSLKKPDFDLYQKVDKLKDIFNRNVDLPADMVDVKDILARLGKLENPLDNVKLPKGKGATTPKTALLEQEARKYKSAEEFVKAQGENLYHGTPREIIGDKLTYGMKSGQDSGGIFLTDNRSVADVFSFGGKVHELSPAIKKQVIDLTTPNGIGKIKSYIGKSYKTFDGETMVFTKDDFDLMFPGGKTDFASVSQYPELIQKIVKDNKMRGIAFNEYAGGKTGKTFQILEGDIPILKQESLFTKKEKLKELDADLRDMEQYADPNDFPNYESFSEEYNILKSEIDDYESQLIDIWNKANKLPPRK